MHSYSLFFFVCVFCGCMRLSFGVFVCGVVYVYVCDVWCAGSTSTLVSPAPTLLHTHWGKQKVWSCVTPRETFAMPTSDGRLLCCLCAIQMFLWSVCYVYEVIAVLVHNNKVICSFGHNLLYIYISPRILINQTPALHNRCIQIDFPY